MLRGKHILLGVTGSIAAYKAAYMVRALVKAGAEVRVLMTPMAKEFISPLTLATLSRHPILVDFYNPENGDWNSHVSLGIWADLYLIAPASANTIAKMATGVADNLLLTTYLSSRAPVMLAPAMDVDMYQHPATQTNLAILKELGVQMIEAQTGFLASGLEGKGRMEEPEEIVAQIEAFFAAQTQSDTNNDYAGRRILITAGPTQEAIDPVRYLTNHSSGKMGYALAEELARRGAEVCLVSGPTGLQIKHPAITKMDVVSAQQMYDAVMEQAGSMDSAILCAAVADYTPALLLTHKIKRHEGEGLRLELTPTKDIAAALGVQKANGRLSAVLVGFALETDNEIEHAKAKLLKKNLDMIVLNSLNDPGAGFSTATNKITLLHKDGRIQPFPLKFKDRVAADIADALAEIMGCSRN